MKTVWSILPPKNSEKTFGKHPTQKPFQLLERIILASSKEGDLVLDPFCGSGTTGVAAIKNNRKFIGMEINPEYIDLATKRIKSAKENNLF